MYGFKEKSKFYRDMANPEHAIADLALLKSRLPDSPDVQSASINPVRAHKEILWTLLDYFTADQIRQNRRLSEDPVVVGPEDPSGDETGQSAEGAPEAPVVEQPDVPVKEVDKKKVSKKKTSSKTSTGKTSAKKTSNTQR